MTVHSVHDHDEPLGPIEDNPIWRQDNVTLDSVGIDIGSSGTQVLFSRLRLRRIGESLTTRYVVVHRETRYRSPVALTPYAGAERIDAEALGSIIDRAYGAAAVRPSDIDTGVVILTGEALRRRNAEAIATVLAERGGELVTATAGHNMEAMLAAYGSGAARVSHDTGRRILNVDIGGGTTKLAVLEHGRPVTTAALALGGRLLVVDDRDLLVRLDPAGRQHATRAGYTWNPGDLARPEDLERVAETMADALIATLTAHDAAERYLTEPLEPDAITAHDVGERYFAEPLEADALVVHDMAEFYLTEPLEETGPIDGVMFSGGVAEYVYGREDRGFGDLGRVLGRALRRRVDSGALPFPLLPPGECIRATALGASEYSVQLSGNTGCITDPDALLPRRNLQVVRPDHRPGETVDPLAVAEAIRRRVLALDADLSGADIVLAMSWDGPPSYDRLLPFALGIRDGLADRIARGRPVYVILDGDVAMTLGGLLREELHVGTELLVVDGLGLRDFDYVDLGRVRYPSGTVPVTIKSLVFGA